MNSVVLGTHYMRSANNKVARVRIKPREGWLLATEEGLAALNTHKHYSDKRLWTPALIYWAAVQVILLCLELST